jgi:uncharacterized membrane protein
MHSPTAAILTQARTTSHPLTDGSGAIALGLFTLVLPLSLLVAIARRQYLQRLTQQQRRQLERAWQLRPAPHFH